MAFGTRRDGRAAEAQVSAQPLLVTSAHAARALPFFASEATGMVRSGDLLLVLLAHLLPNVQVRPNFCLAPTCEVLPCPIRCPDFT